MTIRARATSAALVMVLSIALAGCGGGDKPDADPADTSPTKTATSPSSSTPPRTPEQAAVSKARAALSRYLRISDQIYLNPKVPVSRLKTVAIGLQLQTVTSDVQHRRAKGWRNVGTIGTTILKVDRVSLDNSDPQHGKVPMVRFDVCSDVSKSRTLDRSGHSVVPTNRPDRFRTQFFVGNYHWTTDKARGWRVVLGKSMDQPC